MKKRTAFIGVILFLYTFPFLNDEVFARSNVNNILVAELRPIPGIKYGSYRLFNRAGKNYEKGNYKEAIKLFSKYIIKYSTYADDYVRDAYYYRALSKVSIEDYDGAISDFTKAIEIYPEYTSAYLNRGAIKLKIEDHYAAISDFTKAIEINPESVQAYLFRGATKLKIEDLKGACFDAKKIASLGYINEKNNDWIKNNCKRF